MWDVVLYVCTHAHVWARVMKGQKHTVLMTEIQQIIATTHQIDQVWDLLHYNIASPENESITTSCYYSWKVSLHVSPMGHDVSPSCGSIM